MSRLGRSQPFRPLFKRPDLGPVYFDNSSTSGYEATLSTYNWNHTVGTNTNRYLVVSVGIFLTGSVTSITYGAQSLTLIRTDTNGTYRSELWGLVAPASGTAAITVTLNAALTSIAGATSWRNVNQTTPYSANAGNNGTNTPATCSITPTTANNRVFGSVATATASGVTDQIGQANHFISSGALGTLSGSESGTVMGYTYHRPYGILLTILKNVVATAKTTTLQWNGLGASDSWAVSMIAIQPASASATVVTRFLNLLGVGL